MVLMLCRARLTSASCQPQPTTPCFVSSLVSQLPYLSIVVLFAPTKFLPVVLGRGLALVGSSFGWITFATAPESAATFTMTFSVVASSSASSGSSSMTLSSLIDLASSASASRCAAAMAFRIAMGESSLTLTCGVSFLMAALRIAAEFAERESVSCELSTDGFRLAGLARAANLFAARTSPKVTLLGVGLVPLRAPRVTR